MLIRQTVLYFPAQILGPVFLFAAIIVFTHWLSPEQLGIYALVTATQEFASLLSMVWFSVYGLRYYKEHKDAASQQQYLATERAIMAWVGFFIAALTLILFALLDDVTMTFGLVASAFAFIVTRTFATHLAERARADGNILSYTILQVSGPVFGLLLGLLACAYWRAEAELVFWSYAAAQTAGILLNLRRLDLAFAMPRIDRNILGGALRFGTPIALGGALSWVALNGVRFVIEHFGTVQQVGLVAAGWGIGLRGVAFGAMVVTAAAFPLAVSRLQQGGKSAAEEQMGRNGLLLWITLAPTAAGLYAVGDTMIATLVAESFREMSVAVLPASIVAGLAHNLRMHFYGQYFLLFERPGVLAIVDLIEAICVVAFASYGMITNGPIGAVIGATLGGLVGLAITIATTMRMFTVKLPYVEILITTLATAVMAAVVMNISGDPSLTKLLLQIALGMALYPALLSVMSPSLRRQAMAFVRTVGRTDPA